MIFLRPAVTVAILFGGLSAHSSGQAKQQPVIPTAHTPAPNVAAQPAAETLQFFGGGRGRTESEAIQRATFNATQLAIARIAEVLFSSPDYPGLYGAQALEDYVSKSGRVAETRATSSAGAFQGYARFELKQGYAQLSTIRDYAIPTQPPAGEPWGLFLVPMSLSGDPTQRRVEVRAGQPSNGNFVFQLSVRRRDDRAVWIRVDSIRVLQDGAPGAAVWLFEVWANGQRVILLPEARYDDRAGMYAVSSEGVVRADGGGYIEFRVIGRRGKLIQKK